MYELESSAVGSVAAGGSVVFVGPPEQTRERLLSALADGSEDGVLLVTTGDARGGADALRQRGVAADAIGLVDASGAGLRPDGIAEATAVDGPGDLPTLGIETSDLLDRIGHRHDTLRVGLLGVDVLIKAVSAPATFRFLHLLRGRCRSADALLVATLDPGAIDEGTRRTIEDLFDEVVPVEVE